MNHQTFLRRSSTALLLVSGFFAPALHAAPPAQPEITFGATGGVVSSVTVNSPLYFGLTSAFNSSSLQLRILDVFPTTTNTGANFSGNNNYLVQSSGSYSLGYTAMSSNDVDSDSAGDAIFFIYGSSNYNFTNGATVVFSGSGTANPGSTLQMPVSGTYTAYLVSGANGSTLSSPISVKVNGTSPIPEPSSCAAIAGALALGAVATRRRRRG
jgi:MYXO-CTERM domain-containing protein